MEDGFVNKMNEKIQSKNALTFAGECYIFRKKWIYLFILNYGFN